MRLFDINGRLRFKNVADRTIDWNGDSKSKFQNHVKALLRPIWSLHLGVYEEFPVYGTRYTLDFFNAQKKIAVEVQGGHHTKFTKYFQASEFDFLQQLKIDETKRRFCDINGIKLVEVFWDEKSKLSIKYLQELGL